jgi:hypothetical protein
LTDKILDYFLLFGSPLAGAQHQREIVAWLVEIGRARKASRH